METKAQSKNATERNEPKNRGILKFQRVSKENICPIPNDKQKRKLYDCESLKEIIQNLKEENGELKQVIKIQQTQLHYFREQQKNIINGADKEDDRHLLMHKNMLLKRKIINLQGQITKIKKSCKYSHIKQLEIAAEDYLEQIKSLTAKLKSHSSQKTNISQLNEIIEKEYFTYLRNKEVEKKLAEKQAEILKNERAIRKLKNLNIAKAKQYDKLKESYDEVAKETKKIRNMEDYVHKSELLSKKKQLLTMSETIENMEIKLHECQAKAQTLQQQNIENMNREAMKRKQLLSAYQNLKQRCSQLQNMLMMNNQLAESNIQNIRLDKVPTESQIINKQKLPFFVTVNELSETIEELVYVFQINNLEKNNGIELLLGKKNEGIEGSSQQISMREIMFNLEESPFNIKDYLKKQFFARYCTEDNCEESPYIKFDAKVNIDYVKSVLKTLLPDFYLFSEDEKIDLCSEIQRFLKNYSSILKQNLKQLSKQEDRKSSEAYMSNSSCFTTKTKEYLCSDIFAAIKRQGELSEYALSFIVFRTFKIKNDHLTLQQYQQRFNIQQQMNDTMGEFCVFLTQKEKDDDEILGLETKGSNFNQVNMEK